jgi:signal transduction histidine kinase
MRVSPGLGAKVVHLLLRRWWLVVLLIALIAISLEVVDYPPGDGEGFDSDSVRELVVWGLILPLICGFVLMALAWTNAISTTIQAEQHRIARDLHDTLAQNLGYLRLKLDQLSHDGALQEIVAIRQELHLMSEIADATYEQVQGELVRLYLTSSSDLQTALLSQARLIASRAGFQVQFASEGVPRSVPPDVQNHLFYLLGEALTNIEKHAAARLVRIKLEWATDTLTVTLTDDGRGFEPGTILLDGHLGLAIMRERAREVNALYTLTSYPGVGTQLILRLPLAPSGVPIQIGLYAIKLKHAVMNSLYRG